MDWGDNVGEFLGGKMFDIYLVSLDSLQGNHGQALIDVTLR